MAVWIDSKYANLLSGRVQRFKRVQNNFNLRCPLCGDSKKNQSKARGWILVKNNKSRYYCFNCSASLSFQAFLKKIDETLFFEYVKESLLERGQNPEVIDFVQKLKPPKFVSSTQLSTLKKVSQLHPDHPVKQYIEKRQIPTEYHYKLFYAPKYKQWINSIIPDRFSLAYDEPRIIIPLLSESKELMGVQCRSLDPRAEVKYITILFDENNPKIYGLEDIDKSKTIYALEGPIDAMFLTNAIASCGGKIDTIVKSCNIPKENVIIVYDNEPRNKHTVEKMESAISSGYKVCVWPSQIKHKDINDMILSGMTLEYIESTIEQNSCFGPSGMLMLSAWRMI
jgi:hypothetical protein